MVSSVADREEIIFFLLDVETGFSFLSLTDTHVLLPQVEDL